MQLNILTPHCSLFQSLFHYYQVIRKSHLYAILFTSIYAAFRLQGKNKLYALLSLFVGFGISAVQLVPGIELLSVAARANHSYEQMMKTILIQPWQILMAFFPNLYGNPVSRTYWPLDTYVGKVTSIGLIPLFFSSFFDTTL